MSGDRLNSLINKSNVLSNLMRSRLALPLLYPLNTAGYRGANPIAESRFSQKEIVDSIACLTPLIQGVVGITRILKTAHAISNYQGGRMRQSFVLKPEEELKVQNRIHEVTPRINRKHRARTITGLGANWDRYGSGRPIDNLPDRWKN